MRRAKKTAAMSKNAVRGLAFAAALSLVGCALDAEGNLAPEAGSPPKDSGTVEVGIDVNRPDVACFPPNKLCDDICADFDDPDYGCTPGKCIPCVIRDHGVMGCSTNECVITDCDDPYWNCNGNPLDGCEVSLWSLDHCGACGVPCTVANAISVCTQGRCEIGACSDGWGDCDGEDATGCETDLRTLANCGDCGSSCTVPSGEPTCVTGTCAINSCDPNRADCNGDTNDGCETDLLTLENCGACDRLCDPPNGVGACSAGACIIQACLPGFGDCNGDPLDGCETNVRDNVDNCGACGQPCKDNHALGRSCSQGLCVPTCESGWRNCNGPHAGDQDDGCERDVYTLTSCGDCDAACAPNHAAATCPLGVCVMGACDPGWADCDHLLGCERNIASDANNCGGCDNHCLIADNSSSACNQGTCVINCYAGWGNCNGTLLDGCEVDTNHSAIHCGACGHACQDPAHASSYCDGSCKFACDAGWDDCNAQGSDGCEADLSLPAHCGACANACPQRPHATRTCDQGTCGFTCDSGWADCNGQAADGCESNLGAVTTCGTCNVACSSPPHGSATCNAGACGFTCNAGFADCNGQATDGCEVSLSLPSNCGACGNNCVVGPNGTPSCVNGACAVSCTTGWANCNQDLSDGCEADLAVPAHCGSCSNPCPTPAHATATCASGTCGYTCAAGWDDCDGNPANGCETDLLNDPTRCGSCANSCADPAYASPTCLNGQCGFVCDANRGDCDGDPANGCEADLLADASHCGGCSTACSSAPPNATPACLTGACGFACNTGADNCDGDDTNGCETNVANDPANCGGCAQACADADHATAICAIATCELVCDAGFASCDGDDTNGCETDLSVPATCGSCTNACPAPSHASATCNPGGTCGFWCDTGWGDCDGDASNGCETDLTLPVTCGSCSNTCSAPTNASATCGAGGACGFSCNIDFANCDGVEATGCESDLANDPDHCGDCATVCPTGGTDTQRGCASKQCTLSCVSGMEDCNADLSDGCECAVGCCSDGGGCGC